MKKSSGTNSLAFKNKFKPGDIVKHIDDRYLQSFNKRGYIHQVIDPSKNMNIIGYYLVQFENEYGSRGCWEESLIHFPPVQFVI